MSQLSHIINENNDDINQSNTAPTWKQVTGFKGQGRR